MIHVSANELQPIGIIVPRWVVIEVVARVHVQQGHIQQVEEREVEPVVPRLVVEPELPAEARGLGTKHGNTI